MSRVKFAVIEPTGNANTETGLTPPVAATRDFPSSTSITPGTGSLRLATTAADVMMQTPEGDWVVAEIKSGSAPVRLWHPEARGALAILVAARAVLAGTAAASIFHSGWESPHSVTAIVGATAIREVWVDTEIELSLIPPRVEYRRLPVQLRFVGKDEPRVFYDPDRD